MKVEVTKIMIKMATTASFTNIKIMKNIGFNESTNNFMNSH